MEIEIAFKALKTNGFTIEDIQLTDINRVCKLFALVIVAFACVYKAVIYLDVLNPIKTKNRSRKAKS